MNNQAEKEVVRDITNYINNTCVETDEFVKEMSRQHRTLQQVFTQLCLKWIETCASDDYQHDLRNQASHEISKQIIESFQVASDFANSKPSNYLPLI
jgi:hypothetical protein